MFKIVRTEPEQKKKRKKRKRRRSTTKFIMFLMMFITVIVVAFSIYMTWLTMEMSVLAVLIPCVFVETATCTGFYFWRRKIDAMIEYKKEYGEEFIENTLDDL